MNVLVSHVGRWKFHLPHLLPPTNEVCEGNLFTSGCLFNGGREKEFGFPACTGNGVGLPSCTRKVGWLPNIHWGEGILHPRGFVYKGRASASMGVSIWGAVCIWRDWAYRGWGRSPGSSYRGAWADLLPEMHGILRDTVNEWAVPILLQ